MHDVRAENTYFYTERKATEEDAARIIGYSKELKDFLDKIHREGISLKLSVPLQSQVTFDSAAFTDGMRRTQ